MTGHSETRDRFAAMLVAQADLRSAVVEHARSRSREALSTAARVQGYQHAWEVAARAAMDAVGLDPTDVYEAADAQIARRNRF